MNLFLPLPYALENVGREIVVFQIVEAALDHLAQVERLGPASLGGQKIQALLGLGGKSDGSCHA